MFYIIITLYLCGINYAFFASYFVNYLFFQPF